MTWGTSLPARFSDRARSKRRLRIAGAGAEHFRCERLLAKVSRATCAERARIAGKLRLKDGQIRGEVGKLEQGTYAACRGCPIGAVHKTGKVHPGAPTVAPPTLPSGHRPPQPGEIRKRVNWRTEVSDAEAADARRRGAARDRSRRSA